MSAGDDRLTAFFAAVDKIPPSAVVSYRGCPPGTEVPTRVLVTQSITATSMDPAVARYGGLRELFVVVGRTGRLLAGLSARPQDQEVVHLPGTALSRVASVELAGQQVVAHLFEEIVPDGIVSAPADGLPSTYVSLVEHVRRQVAAAGAAPDGVPDRFAGVLA